MSDHIQAIATVEGCGMTELTADQLALVDEVARKAYPWVEPYIHRGAREMFELLADRGMLAKSAADRIAELERVLTDWLDCCDTSGEWMRCRNNAKIALGRKANPTEYVLTECAD